VANVMTRTPLTIGPEALAVEAAQLMDRTRKSQLLVVDRAGQLVGALNNLDLMNAKVI
jgi:arabinose-5-phosphate isomerase